MVARNHFPPTQGFTLIELIAVVSLVGLLAGIAVPAYQEYLRRSRVAEALLLSGPVKQAVEDYYAWHGRLPVDNRAAGVAAAGQLHGRDVRHIEIVDGVIRVGLNPDRFPAEAALSFQPVLDAVHPLKIAYWVCAGEPAPIREAYLPASCK